MTVSYYLSIAAVDGTEALNVERMVDYAAEQLGLRLSETFCGSNWQSYRTRLAGSPEDVSHLLELVGVAYPAAEIHVVASEPAA